MPGSNENQGDVLTALCADAEALFREGRFGDGLGRALQAVSIDPDCLAAHRLCATGHVCQQNHAEAAAAWAEVVRLAPDDSHAWAQRALALAVTRKYYEAVQAADRALALNPDDHDALQTRALALGSAGHNGPADATLRQHFVRTATDEELESADHASWVAGRLDHAGRARAAGQPDEAISALSAILAEEPDHHVARAARGETYHAVGRHKEASEDLVRAWAEQRNYYRVARGYLVAAEGTQRSHPLAAFPDSPDGRAAAVALAERTAADPADAMADCPQIGQLVRTVLYRFEGANIEIKDWVRPPRPPGTPERVIRRITQAARDELGWTPEGEAGSEEGAPGTDT